MMTVWHTPPKTFELVPERVHVWRIRLDEHAPDRNTLTPLLSEDERERANRFRFEIDRSRYVVGRGALRTLLAGYMNTAAAEIHFAYSEHGKPAVGPKHNSSDVQFNVSHSGDLILIGVTARRAVGVDVESIDRRVTEDRIAERFFSPDEVERLRSLPEDQQHSAFFECWTRKEAFIKAHGEGLSLSLDSFSVAFGGGEPARLIRFDGDPGPAHWALDAPALSEGYAGAVCVANSKATFTYLDYPAAALNL